MEGIVTGGIVQQPDQQLVGETPSETRVPCEVYSRIVGYLRPIQNWNEGKRQEFADRKMFRVPEKDVNDLPQPQPCALLTTTFEVG